MTNYELISLLVDLWAEYMRFLLPVFGVIGGLWILFRLLYISLYSPWKHE